VRSDRQLPTITAVVMFVAACLMGCGGTEPPPDAQAQIARLGSESTEDRYHALSNLQTLGEGGREAVPELRKMLKTTTDDDMAAEIAKTLGMMGLAASAAVPELSTLLGSKAMWPRYAAAEALGRLGPAAAPALPRLTALTKDPDPDVAAAALESIRRLRRSVPKK